MVIFVCRWWLTENLQSNNNNNGNSHSRLSFSQKPVRGGRAYLGLGFALRSLSFALFLNCEKWEQLKAQQWGPRNAVVADARVKKKHGGRTISAFSIYLYKEEEQQQQQRNTEERNGGGRRRSNSSGERERERGLSILTLVTSRHDDDKCSQKFHLSLSLSISLMCILSQWPHGALHALQCVCVSVCVCMCV